ARIAITLHSCERATARCREAIPPLLGDRQRAACFYSEFAEVTA
ncbi:hypothetical protein ACQR8U_13635, partial [Klebsiella pneumoniae]